MLFNQLYLFSCTDRETWKVGQGVLDVERLKSWNYIGLFMLQSIITTQKATQFEKGARKHNTKVLLIERLK